MKWFEDGKGFTGCTVDWRMQKEKKEKKENGYNNNAYRNLSY